MHPPKTSKAFSCQLCIGVRAGAAINKSQLVDGSVGGVTAVTTGNLFEGTRPC